MEYDSVPFQARHVTTPIWAKNHFFIRIGVGGIKESCELKKLYLSPQLQSERKKGASLKLDWLRDVTESVNVFCLV